MLYHLALAIAFKHQMHLSQVMQVRDNSDSWGTWADQSPPPRSSIGDVDSDVSASGPAPPTAILLRSATTVAASARLAVPKRIRVARAACVQLQRAWRRRSRAPASRTPSPPTTARPPLAAKPAAPAVSEDVIHRDLILMGNSAHPAPTDPTRSAGSIIGHAWSALSGLVTPLAQQAVQQAVTQSQKAVEVARKTVNELDDTAAHFERLFEADLSKQANSIVALPNLAAMLSSGAAGDAVRPDPAASPTLSDAIS